MNRFGARPRPSFSARRPPRTPHQLRADWIAAIMLAGAVARVADEREAASASEAAAFGQNLTRLSLSMRDLEPGNFPVQAESARSMAAAFLKLARDFCHPGWSPQARTACAPFLRAGARCLDGLIDELRAREAEVGRRVLGERDGG
jgi:hypothetical protein